MNLDEKQKKFQKKFKKLSEDFEKNGFVTSNL